MRHSPPFDATPLLRLVARRRIARLQTMVPAMTQERLLLRLVRRAARTRFGTAHGFASIRSVADFQARVPLRRYEDFWDEWWHARYPVLRDVTWPGRVPYFALSSGTTSGRTKFIPVTRAMVRANRGAAVDTLAWHLHANQNSRVFGGLSFMLGGSTALDRLAPGVRQGDLSGIAAAEIPRFLTAWSFPPRNLALIPDWDSKLASLVEETPTAHVKVLTGTPSWMLVLLERLAARHGRPPLPALDLLVHGGVAWAPYRDRLRPFLPPGCDIREVYPASEGFVAIADRGTNEGLRLNLDRGCFFEFVPMAELGSPSPRRHWAATVETGVEYAVVLSSCAGLWAYVLGDTVRILERRPLRLLVTGRISCSLSAFGEHLTGEEMDAALLEAATGLGVAVAEYMVGSVFLGARGQHRWLVELAEPPPGRTDPSDAPLAARLAALLDAALARRNDDYAVHRQARQLDPPDLVLLPAGSFAAWMRSQGKLGGQHKVPRVIADPDRFAAVATELGIPDVAAG